MSLDMRAAGAQYTLPVVLFHADQRLLSGFNLCGVSLNMELKRVLFLQPQPCIRALKYARALKRASRGKIRIIFGHLYHTLNYLYGHGDEVFDKLKRIKTDDLDGGIKRLAEKHRPQIIHSHNAPDFLTVAAIEAVGGVIPIIHDCHEALSMRRTKYYATEDDSKILVEYPRQEKVANEGSDGRVYVSEGMKKYIQRRYNVNPERDMVFINYVSESVVPRRFKEKLSANDDETHIVYVGTVTSRIEGDHYDLREIFKSIADHRLHVHIYVSRFGLEDKAYQELADRNRFIHHHGHLDQRTLLHEMTQYDYGWAGFNVTKKNERHMEVALPNKVIEYIACGLPVLAFPHKTIKEFVEEYKVGLIFNDLDEMVNQTGNREHVKRIRKNVLDSQHEFTMKQNIGKVIDFYQDLCVPA